MNVGLHDRTRSTSSRSDGGWPTCRAAHTPADVADAMRAEGRLVTDASLLGGGRGAATGDGRGRSADPAAARAWCHRRAGERADPGLGGSRATAWSLPTSASPTTARSAGSPSGWPRPAGRRLDDTSPFVDTRLPDGTRVHAALATQALPGTCLSFRVPARRAFSLDDCVATGAVSPSLAAVLARLVESRAAFLVSGGTGSGKTTLLAALLALVPPGERMVVVEDSRELRPDHPHVVSLEGRPGERRGPRRDRPDRSGPSVAADATRPADRRRGAGRGDLRPAGRHEHGPRRGLRHGARQLGGGRPGPAGGARRPGPSRPAGAARPAGVGAGRGGAHPPRSGRAATGQRAARAGAGPGDGLGPAPYRRWTAPARGPCSGPGAAGARDGSWTDDRPWRSPAPGLAVWLWLAPADRVRRRLDAAADRSALVGPGRGSAGLALAVGSLAAVGLLGAAGAARRPPRVALAGVIGGGAALRLVGLARRTRAEHVDPGRGRRMRAR